MGCDVGNGGGVESWGVGRDGDGRCGGATMMDRLKVSLEGLGCEGGGVVVCVMG